jgi:hypothetical protein
MIEVRISSIFRLTVSDTVALLQCVFNTIVFDSIQHGAAFEPFVERISGQLVLIGCRFF